MSAIRSGHAVVLVLSAVLVLTSVVGCGTGPDRLFERRSPQHTGVDFANTITQDDTLMNPLDYLYIYNGGGVGVGDVNGDGRPDLYFAGNMVENRLYLNEGNLQFRDVTAEAQVGAAGVWSTGVAMVDINQDGRLDIYVSAGGPPEAGGERANRLFVNEGPGPDGVPTFEERAAAYGIADQGYTTQAAFFDYDRDGDLDLYLLTNAMQDGNQNVFSPVRTEGQAKSTDHLYRNNGDDTFTDVSAEAGIQIEGYGLGVGISDVNMDGWPDVYVANDFATNDLLYLNNGDGTFTNRIGTVLKHQSYSAMGVDLADFNNDRRVDIMTLDMLPPGNPRLRTMGGTGGRELSARQRRLDYQPQFVRNTLQLNNGPTPEGPRTFSEIAHLAGVHATDWSWAPLLVDFDNDGDRDLFVSNGYGEDVTNLDYIQRRERAVAFGSEKAKRKELLEQMEALPEVSLPNRFFENEGSGAQRPEEGLRFVDQTGQWTPERPGISNGAAFADLDGDGDLDLVTNNINATATLLENHADRRDDAHAVRIHLRGPESNRAGLGAKVTLYTDSTVQYHDHSRYRGYQSSVESIVHFGLGADSTADSLVVRWPDGTRQRRTALEAGQVVTVRYRRAAASSDAEPTVPPANGGGPDSSTGHAPEPPFREVARDRGLAVTHERTARQSTEVSPLLPHTFSRNGPGLAVGDANGDGRDDVFVGGGRGQAGSLFLQTEAGQFARRSLPMEPRYDDQGALFFDADGDGALDLYVVSGGSAGAAGSAVYRDRLYLNDGTGSFRRASDAALPDLQTSGSVVTAADYDGDGDLDLFVGGRVLPGSYPLPPRSALLRNDSEDGTVRFTDVTKKVAPGLAEVGLVSDALWSDYDTDGDRDLLVVGEWMPVTVFENDNGRFEETTNAVGLASTAGWWNSIAAGDFDRDGDPDYVAGNLGLNTQYRGAPGRPLRIHAKDYDQNGDLDPVLTHVLDGTRYPVHGRDAMVQQIPGMKNRFRSYQSYAEAAFSEAFTEEEREGAYVRSAAHLETSYLENRVGYGPDDDAFAVRPLATRTQTAPAFGTQVADPDGDGALDLLMIGNWYGMHAMGGRADAFVGALLDGDGQGQFDYRNYTESGFFVDGDGKALATVHTGGDRSLFLAAQNDARLKAFARSGPRRSRVAAVRPADRWASLRFPDGTTRRVEFYWGSTYLSQSSRTLRVPPSVTEVVIHEADGEQRTLPLDRPSPPRSE